MTLRDLIKQKTNRLASVPEQFLTEVQKTEKTIYADILALLDRLKIDADGKIILSKTNIAVAGQLRDELKKVALTDDYLKAVIDYTKEMDKQAVITDDYMQKAFPDFKESDVANALLEKSKKTAIDSLIGTGLEENFSTPIADFIDTAVSSGSGFIDLRNQIQEYVLSTDEQESKLMQYSGQVAHDAVAFSDRAYTNVLAEELDAEWYLYSGTELPTSRPFCEERKDKFFHYKEIEAWADKDWQGKAEGTNAQTIFITAGGYNCVDSILPVGIAIVPDDVIQRNIDNGNYTP